jgi:hypothetical protein
MHPVAECRLSMMLNLTAFVSGDGVLLYAAADSL